MNNKSIWIKDKKKRNYKKIDRNIEVDILIIGGGISGITTAYFLKDSERKITLIDKSNLGLGVTSKTTAKITYLQEDIYQTLENKFDKDVSRKYYDSQKEAIELIKNIIEENNISCDLKKIPSIIFTTKKENINKIDKEKEILNSWNINVEDVVNENIEKGIKVNDTYTFHPIKYLDGLIDLIEDKITIYENTIAKSIIEEDNKYKIETDNGIITANEVVVANHYPFFLLPVLIPLKTYIKREYVNVGKKTDVDNFSAISIDEVLHSIRFYKNYIIYGSNKNRLTTKIDYKINYDKSRNDFSKYFNGKPIYTWMNQDIMSNDSLPFIGRIKDGMYLLTAYNAWGMTNSTIGAKLVSDLILNNKNKYEELFYPKRINIPLITESILGSFHYLKAYTQSLWKKNNPYYITFKDIRYGIYTDNENKKHIIKMLCPHMKCSLVFNREEKTWDCPCHGSRFDIDGNIIEGPSVEKVTTE